MDLLGLIGGPAPRSTGGGGKAPAPGPEGGANAFGDFVASSRRQHLTQSGTGDAGAGSGDPPEHVPGLTIQAADSPATGLIAGAPPDLPAETVATAPDAEPPDAESPAAGAITPPGAAGEPILRHDIAFGLHGALASAEARAGTGTPDPAGAAPRAAASAPPIPAAGGPPVQPAGSQAQATPGIAFTSIPGSPGADADAAVPPPRAAGEAAAPAPGESAVRPPPREPGTISPRMTGAETAPTTIAPGPRPASDLPGRIRTGGRAAPPVPASPPIGASAPPPVESGPGPMPVVPDLPSAPARARGQAVGNAAMQASGETGQAGFAASPAAAAASLAGGPQAQAALAGGAEIARAVAPQIAVAIGSGPGSGRIELRLDPPELGAVEITLEITDQSLRATLVAERPAINELLRRHSEILLAQLQQAGFTGVDLQFAGNRAGEQGGARPGETASPASAGDGDAPPQGDNADQRAGRVARRTTDGVDLRL